MRIKTRPATTSFETGLATAHMVSVVGRIPGNTIYVEQDIAVVPTVAEAPGAVGAHLTGLATKRAYDDVAEAKGHNHAQALFEAGQLPVNVPAIPGVTVPGEWVNPKFGDKEAWRAKHSLAARGVRA